MLDALAVHLPKFRGREAHVRCFAHVLNLVVKAILSQFSRKRRAEGETADDVDKANEELNALDDDDVDEEDTEAAAEAAADEGRDAADNDIIEDLDQADPELVLDREDVRFGQMAFEKIMKLAQKVHYSPHIRAELAKLAAEANLNSEVLVRP
ncbi:hypothetical protein OH76DRAFT_1301504, partial [Lentinus brumalis]